MSTVACLLKATGTDPELEYYAIGRICSHGSRSVALLFFEDVASIPARRDEQREEPT